MFWDQDNDYIGDAYDSDENCADVGDDEPNLNLFDLQYIKSDPSCEIEIQLDPRDRSGTLHLERRKHQIIRLESETQKKIRKISDGSTFKDYF